VRVAVCSLPLELVVTVVLENHHRVVRPASGSTIRFRAVLSQV
jgi:hypothetical protein